jgi:YHS domain-containing protein/thiol-disulfide isomerase/thioredoxin
MRRHLPHFLFFVGAMLAAPAAAEHAGVRWQQDIETAKATAKQTGRLVLVHFWTPSCAPCLMLEQNVFNQPGIAGAIEAQFVPVKLNANENSATATGFGITRVPTDVILTPDGQVVGKLISPPTPAAYIAEMSQVANQFATKGGQAFAKAAAAAPVPSQLNSAYANLQVAPDTMPAATAPSSVSTSDRYAMASTASPGLVGSNSFSPGALQSVQAGTFAPWSSPSQSPTTAAPAATTAATPSPSLTPVVPAPVFNPYLPAGQTGMSAQPATSPGQMANPHVGGGQTAPPVIAPTTVAQASTQSPVQNAATVGGAVMQSSAPDPRALPPNAPPLGFDGYCPVSMRQHWKWVPGDPRYGVVHAGRTYWFAGPNEQQQFLADPHRFSPALSGMDPVMAVDHRQQVPGKREHSIDYDNLIYMFSSEATLQQFAATPERYATSVRQAMGIQRGRLAR